MDLEEEPASEHVQAAAVPGGEAGEAPAEAQDVDETDDADEQTPEDQDTERELETEEEARDDASETGAPEVVAPHEEL